jgi:hypothetical protein
MNTHRALSNRRERYVSQSTNAVTGSAIKDNTTRRKYSEILVFKRPFGGFFAGMHPPV